MVNGNDMCEEVRYRNTDILLMDPAYSRLITTDEDTELECIDMVAETLVDGLYYVFSGNIKEYDEDTERFQTDNALYVFGLDTGRIGIYDYSKVMAEQPELRDSIEGKKYFAAIIRNFSGSVSCLVDEHDEVHVVGVSDDGEHDFFTIEYL